MSRTFGEEVEFRRTHVVTEWEPYEVPREHWAESLRLTDSSRRPLFFTPWIADTHGSSRGSDGRDDG